MDTLALQPDFVEEQWEYTEACGRIYGRVTFNPDLWPTETVLPTKELVAFIDLGVRRVLQPYRAQGWEADEPIDARALWTAGRIEYRVTRPSLLSASVNHTVVLHKLCVSCRRRVR